ncbi:MAG TPA: hypothetical protein QGH28_06385 [Chloroflexota bacterium]|nr:hypothetical protein [Chloroflexota bacterium]
MRRWSRALLAGLLLIGLLAGCARDSGDEAATTTSAAPAPPAVESLVEAGKRR